MINPKLLNNNVILRGDFDWLWESKNIGNKTIDTPMINWENQPIIPKWAWTFKSSKWEIDKNGKLKLIARIVPIIPVKINQIIDEKIKILSIAFKLDKRIVFKIFIPKINSEMASMIAEITNGIEVFEYQNEKKNTHVPICRETNDAFAKFSLYKVVWKITGINW